MHSAGGSGRSGANRAALACSRSYSAAQTGVGQRRASRASKRAAMWLLALLATTSHAAIKVDKKLEGEYGLRCSECVLTAHHAQYTIQDLIRRDERWERT